MADQPDYDTDTSDMLVPHNMLRSAFGDAGRAIGSARAGDDARVAAVGTFYDNVLRLLAVHHGAEDELLWPKLRQRAPQHSDTYDRMEGQHANIAVLDHAAADSLEAWSGGPDAETAAALVAALGNLSAALDQHLREEEREILPIATRTVSPEEWAELPGHALRAFDGDKPWLILGLLFEQMTEEQQAHVVAQMPPPSAARWTETGRAAYAEFIAEYRA